jgi:hypothetical protein
MPELTTHITTTIKNEERRHHVGPRKATKVLVTNAMNAECDKKSTKKDR